MGIDRHVRSAVFTALATCCAAAIAADEFPRKPVTLIVGYGAGGGTDTYARAMASVAPEYINLQPLVVVNKPGGSSVPAAKYVADSNPDGHTLHLASAGALYFSTQFRKAPVDPVKDFKMVCQIGRLLPAVHVSKDSPIQDVKQLLAHAKANAGKIRFATPGRTSTWGIAGLAFAKRNGIQGQDVPAKGGAPTRALVIGNQVDYGVFGIHLRKGFEGQLRTLGLLFPERDPNNPDIPTLKEQGVAFTEVYTPMLIMAPRDTPDANVKALDEACKKISEHEAFVKLMQKSGLPVKYLSGADATKRYDELIASWSPLVTELKGK
jgi:tripartite-type tricarboxylate transporter receptor subunit TctC